MLVNGKWIKEFPSLRMVHNRWIFMNNAIKAQNVQWKPLKYIESCIISISPSKIRWRVLFMFFLVFHKRVKREGSRAWIWVKEVNFIRDQGKSRRDRKLQRRVLDYSDLYLTFGIRQVKLKSRSARQRWLRLLRDTVLRVASSHMIDELTLEFRGRRT